MMTLTSRKFWIGAALTLTVTIGAYGAEQAPFGLVDFEPVALKDGAGAKLDQAIVTYQDKAYEIRLNGLGVGGAIGVTVTVIGEVHGMTDIMDLEGVYVPELSGPGATDVSSDDLWLGNDHGVQIRLYTDDPDVVIAPGSDEVNLLFGWGQ